MSVRAADKAIAATLSQTQRAALYLTLASGSGLLYKGNSLWSVSTDYGPCNQSGITCSGCGGMWDRPTELAQQIEQRGRWFAAS